MRKVKLDFVSLTIFVLLTANVASFSFMAKGQITPTVYIDPASKFAHTGTFFSVNVSVSTVTDLCSWQVFIYFRNDIVNAVGYAEGPFLESYGTTIFDGSFDNNYNDTHGELWMYCLRTWSGQGVDGDGPLATATFSAEIGGTTQLTLAKTILGNSTAMRISHTTTDGTVEVGRHDVAVTSLTPTKTIVGQDGSMNITVTVENQGDETETFNVTAYANTITIQTQTTTLPKGNSTTMTFTWNTTGFTKGNYTISAYATPLPGETDTADNTYLDGWVIISMIGDITGPDGWPDGKVDMRDVAAVARLFGKEYPDPEYDPNCDLVYDLKIDMRDVATVARHFGETDP